MKLRTQVAVLILLSACSSDGDSPAADSGVAQDSSAVDAGADAIDAAAETDSEACSFVEPPSGSVGQGCTASVKYQCGAHVYGIDCSCPDAVCVCTQDDVAVGTAAYGTCPNCPLTFGAAAAECGFPSPGGIGVGSGG